MTFQLEIYFLGIFCWVFYGFCKFLLFNQIPEMNNSMNFVWNVLPKDSKHRFSNSLHLCVCLFKPVLNFIKNSGLLLPWSCPSWCPIQSFQSTSKICLYKTKNGNCIAHNLSRQQNSLTKHNQTSATQSFNPFSMNFTILRLLQKICRNAKVAIIWGVTSRVVNFNSITRGIDTARFPIVGRLVYSTHTYYIKLIQTVDNDCKGKPAI